MSQAKRASQILAIGFALIILASPLIALAVAHGVGMRPGLLEPAATWGGVIKGEWWRLISGHGLETATSGIMQGDLPPQTPRGTSV